MALITDPDSLSQGTENIVADLAFTASAGAITTLTGATTLPAIAVGEFFEIRDSSTPGNWGLYEETGGAPTTSSITCTKIVGPNPTNLVAESTSVFGTTGAGSEKSVHFDTPTLTIYLIEQGNLSVDGVTMLAFHSFAKLEWKSDAFLIAAAPFPMVGISFAAGQWVFGQDPSGNNSGWKPAEDNVVPATDLLTRQLFRNAGWLEVDSSGNTIRKYANITTLPTTGAFEDAADQAYYRFGTDATDTAAAVDYVYTGEVNEPVKFFEEFGNPDTCNFITSSTITRATGSFITDGYQIGGQVTVRNSAVGDHNGTFVLTNVVALTLTVTGTPFTTGLDTAAQLAVDNDNVFDTFLRIRDADPSGKTFAKADLAAGGETVLDSKIIKLGLANATDNDIDIADPVTGAPYDEIRLRYLDADFNLGVDSATLRAYGIVADVGTYSQVNMASDGTTTVTSANWTTVDTLADFAGGTITLHDATAPDRAVHTIVGTPTAPGSVLTVVLSSALTNTESNLSFTMQRATPITASKQQIYEKVHYQLRQASDIDESETGVVVGKTADDTMLFSGADLRCGSLTPTNPNGGGSGVIIQGFDANDTNNLFFWDNGDVSRNFPFVAAGSIVVNQGLVDDTDGEVWLFYEYTRRTTGSTVDVVAPSGDTYDLESDAGLLGTYSVNDYLLIAGFAQAENNGLFIVTVVNIGDQDYTVRKVDGTPVGTAETDQTVSVDENPYPSPDAIIVDDNSGTDITFVVGALSTAFDYDYENNVQGGRTTDSNAAVVLVGAGLETGQVAVVKNLTITKTTGLTFSLTSPLERNYSNP